MNPKLSTGCHKGSLGLWIRKWIPNFMANRGKKPTTNPVPSQSMRDCILEGQETIEVRKYRIRIPNHSRVGRRKRYLSKCVKADHMKVKLKI